MKAVVKYEEGPHKVRLMDMPIPEPAPKQVRVKVAYAGVCGSDIHMYKEDGGYKSWPPVILGHELSGVVDALGEGCNPSLLGKRVVSETYFVTCGHCFFCVTGHKNLCAGRRSIGSGVNGAMAEYVVVPEHNIHLVPDNVHMKTAAMTEPLACCVQAVLEMGGIIAGDTVLITGPGAIGLMCLQLAVLSGARVVMAGTEKDTQRLALAQEFGAVAVAKTDHPGAQEELAALLGKNGADIIFECSGAGAAINMDLQLIRKGGRFVQVGLAGKPVTLDMNLITLKELKVLGTYAQKPVWWTRALDLLGDGKIKLDQLMEPPVPLEDWQQAFEGFIAGKGMKRLLGPEL